MILDPKDLKSMKMQKERIEENKNIKINSFLNITSTPQPRPHVFLPNKILINSNKKIMKDSQTNTDSFTYQNNFFNKRRISSDKNIIDIISLKNTVRPCPSNFSISYFNNNNIYKNSKIKNNLNNINYKKNNSTGIQIKPQNKRLKMIKEKIIIDSNFSLKKRFKSTNKRKNINNSLYINCKNKKNKIGNKSFEIINNSTNKRKNLIDIENNIKYIKKDVVKKKINTFFNNKYLQENTDIFKIGKYFSNKNDLNIKFSIPKNYNTCNVIVDNNISLENTFKKQTVSNFNNKYYFKFKTNNLKEKEKIKKLFCLLKKHKDSDTDKNCDFLAFHLNRQKKLRKKEMTKAILADYSNPCGYIGRNTKDYFINNDYYTNNNDFESSLIQKQKENKMIKIKSLKKNI